MRMLVTGASGFVGKALCLEASKRGYAVRGAVRSSAFADDSIERCMVGGIDANTDWQEALRGVEVVVHLAARVHVMQETAADPLDAFRGVNVQGTLSLARQAAANGVRRLVYVSSIKVNGEETLDGRRYTEADQPMPQDPYGVSKWEAEQALTRIGAETGLEVVIVRPPLVYGPEVKGNFLQLLRMLAKGLPFPLASVDNQRSLLYVGNMVDAILLCATHPLAAGKTFLLSDGEDLSSPALLRLLAQAMGRPARLFACPTGLIMFAATLIGKRGHAQRLLGSLQIDSDKIRQHLGWQPPYTVQQGMQATVDWFRGTLK